jgi:hypothetical protein
MNLKKGAKITDDNNKIFLPIKNGVWRENYLEITFLDGRWLTAECEDYIPKPVGMNDFPYKETFKSNTLQIVDYGFGKSIIRDDGTTHTVFEGGWMIDWVDDGELLYSDFQFVYEPCVKGYFIILYELRKRKNGEYMLRIGDSRTGKLYKFDFEDEIEKEQYQRNNKSAQIFYEYVMKQVREYEEKHGVKIK